LLDETYNSNQIYAQATDVGRVIQSTYAEFMGLYPPVNSTSTSSFEETLVSGKGLPMLKVRRTSSHLRAQIDGYTLIPTFSYLPLSEYDDVSAQGCNYVNQMV